MCQSERNLNYADSCRCGCGCSRCNCVCCSFTRRFFSAHEELECLEKYREQLKKELEAVDEYIKNIKGK